MFGIDLKTYTEIRSALRQRKKPSKRGKDLVLVVLLKDRKEKHMVQGRSQSVKSGRKLFRV